MWIDHDRIELAVKWRLQAQGSVGGSECPADRRPFFNIARKRRKVSRNSTMISRFTYSYRGGPAIRNKPLRDRSPPLLSLRLRSSEQGQHLRMIPGLRAMIEEVSIVVLGERFRNVFRTGRRRLLLVRSAVRACRLRPAAPTPMSGLTPIRQQRWCGGPALAGEDSSGEDPARRRKARHRGEIIGAEMPIEMVGYPASRAACASIR